MRTNIVVLAALAGLGMPSFGAMPALAEGRYDDAITLLEAGLAEHPGNASILYNLACAESMSGRTVEALTHLQEAVKRNPAYRRNAATDPDFAPIRHEPGFPA